MRLEKWLNLNDQPQRLSVWERIFNRKMIDGILMLQQTSAMDYCIRLRRRGSKAFTQFVDALMET